MSAETKAKVAHTPGPWKVGGEWPELVAVYDSRSIYIAHAETGEYKDWVAENPLGREVGTANAHLIAAAPDLLQSCKELCRRLESNELVNRPSDPCNEYDQPYYDRARAAIAKAEGAQH